MAYKSKFEVTVAKAFKDAGIKFEYESEVVHFVQPEKKRTYTPDWKIRTPTGVVCIVETKGKLDRETRKKLIWVKEQHPKKKIVLLFQNASVKLAKNSPTSYGTWATKSGFEWYDFRNGLPKEWTKQS